MWIFIFLAIIIASVATWMILQIASDADDELDNYREKEIEKEAEN